MKRSGLLFLAFAMSCTGGSGTNQQDGSPLVSSDASDGGGENSDAQGASACAASGSYYLELATSLAQDARFAFSATVEITPESLSLSLQPLCAAGSEQCSPWTPVGSPIEFASSDLEECTYEVSATNAVIPGGANPLSGSESVANLSLKGTIKYLDRLCGSATGTMSNIPIEPAWFASERLANGSVGSGPLAFHVESCQ